MKITKKATLINLNNIVDVSVDVHKDNLCFFFEIGGKEYSDVCANRTTVIQKKLSSYAKIARQAGKKGLRSICEPTPYSDEFGR
jgi:hypothetical protein